MRIVQITSCVNRGEKRDFVNVYGLADDAKIYRWDPVACVWEPYKIEKRDASSAGKVW